jgi:hypothetical protein
MGATVLTALVRGFTGVVDAFAEVPAAGGAVLAGFLVRAVGVGVFLAGIASPPIHSAIES